MAKSLRDKEYPANETFLKVIFIFLGSHLILLKVYKKKCSKNISFLV